MKISITVLKASLLLSSVLSLGSSAQAEDIPYLGRVTPTAPSPAVVSGDTARGGDIPYLGRVTPTAPSPSAVSADGPPFFGPPEFRSSLIPVSVDAPVPGYCLDVNETGFQTLGSLPFRFGTSWVYLANPDRNLSATRTLVASAPSECATDNYLPLVESVQFVSPDRGDYYGPLVKITFVGSKIVLTGRLGSAYPSRSPTFAAALEESEATGKPVRIFE